MPTEFELPNYSNFYANIVNISSQNFSNCLCKIHINEYEMELPIILAISCFTNITQEMMSDPMLQEFNIKVDFKYEIDETFIYKILSLIYNHRVTLNTEEVVNLACLGESIDNRCFMIPYEKYAEELESSLSVDNCIELLSWKHRFHFDIQKCSKEITLIASNFDKLKQNIISIANDIKYLPVIHEILQSQNLKLENEDSLLNFILALCDINREYEYLFENLCLEYCTSASVQSFVAYINNNIKTTHYIEAITKCISRRLLDTNIPKTPKYMENRHKENVPKPAYSEITEANINNGILHTLNSSSKVILKASSTDIGNVTELLNPNSTSGFVTCNEPDSWIEASLKDNKSFYITKFMIKGSDCNPDRGDLERWELEGKRARDSTWKFIHEYDNFIKKGQTYVFSISEDEKFTAVRLTQIDPNTKCGYDLNIGSFDFIGKYEN